MTFHTLYNGDARHMAALKDESVELAVTSPPYWSIKDYGHPRQIGFGSDYKTYLDDLNLVWLECRRVLKPGCRLCVNVGDLFARASPRAPYKVIPIREETTRFCLSIGFDYLGAAIWRKQTTSHPSGGARVMGSYPFPRNGVIRIDYEFVLVFRKPGDPPRPSPEAKAASRLSPDDWNKCFAAHWSFPGERSGPHPAPFPLELPTRLIKMFSFAGETILDPFMGSGTTALAARRLGRNSVGYEINPDFIPVYAGKAAAHDLTLPDDSFSYLSDDASLVSTPSYSLLPYTNSPS